MNKTAIKTFAIWARNKLMNDIESNAYLIGITKDGVQDPLPQSTKDVQYFNIGSGTPYALDKNGIVKRNKLVRILSDETKNVGYDIAYRNLIEHTASTWFNRLCAIRFMEVNEYFSDGLRVLSSMDEGRKDSDLMVSPFESDLEFSENEQLNIKNWKLENNDEELFSFLLLKKCSSLSEILPGLFVKEEEPISLLVHFSIADAEGIVYGLVNDIDEEDWKEQVQIIGWLYQFYNSEFKDETYTLLRQKDAVLTKDRIPAVTQLFTPEWIVKYMVENSLGKIWIDGHPNEALKSNWNYYLDEANQKSEVEAKLQKVRGEYAELRPEDISFADVCMGSGHILCYAFDVLMQIYESLGYTARDAVLSIIDNNLYGLDIDERAYQLAYFSVMMKARQYDRGAFRRGYEPKVYAFEESNGITEKQLSIFGVDLNDIERNLAAEQMKALIETFHDAKEYGSILKVEPMDWALLRRFISSYDIYGKLDLMEMEVGELVQKIKHLINIGEVLSRKYWVTCTNPPYMAPTPVQKPFIETHYRIGKSDLYACFMIKNNELLNTNGISSTVTMQSWMTIASYEEFRTDFILRRRLHSLMQMDNMVLGIAFGTTVTILGKYQIEGFKSIFHSIKLADVDKGEVKEIPISDNRNAIMTTESFDYIPGAPIAYWISNKLLEQFENQKIGDIAKGSVGIKTGNNERFIRTWWEPNVLNVDFLAKSLNESIYGGKKWFPYNKGGEYRRWYGNEEYVINWYDNGSQIREYCDKSGHHCQSYASDLMFKPLVTWSSVTNGRPSFRYKNYGQLSDMAGIGLYSDEDNLKLILGFCNSKVGDLLLEVLAPTINIKLGPVSSMPLIVNGNNKSDIIELVDNLIEISKNDWDSFETSWNYKYHPLISAFVKKNIHFDDVSTTILSDCYQLWEGECKERFIQLKTTEEKLNQRFIDCYGVNNELTPSVEDSSITIRQADLQRDIKNLISYAVGCMFGRYSLNMEGLAFAGGDWDEAFANNYQTFKPDDDNCIPITDENYFSDDIVGRFVEFIRLVYGENSLESNLQFIADAIGGKGDDAREVIRKYFLNDFFKDHCKTYSVTGSGKRPIYWLFDSGRQNGFKALVYMHRWTGDTIATVRARYVSKMQEKYENELRAIDLQMEHMSDPRQKATLQKRKEKILKQVDEIKQYDELIGHLALEHIDIDLDDGVKTNHEKVQHDRNGDKYQILAPIK